MIDSAAAFPSAAFICERVTFGGATRAKLFFGSTCTASGRHPVAWHRGGSCYSRKVRNLKLSGMEAFQAMRMPVTKSPVRDVPAWAQTQAPPAFQPCARSMALQGQILVFDPFSPPRPRFLWALVLTCLLPDTPGNSDWPASSCSAPPITTRPSVHNGPRGSGRRRGTG